MTYLDDLLRGIRLNVLLAKVKPYKTVGLAFLAKELQVSVEDIRSLLSELILEEKIKGQIDQLNGFLEVSSAGQEAASKHLAMRDWAKTLQSLHLELTKKFNA